MKKKPDFTPNRVRIDPIYRGLVFCQRFKITWGEPAKIVQAVFDKECPHCGAKPSMEYELCFEMDIDENGRACAKCHNCDYSF